MDAGLDSTMSAEHTEVLEIQSITYVDLRLHARPTADDVTLKSVRPRSALEEAIIQPV